MKVALKIFPWNEPALYDSGNWNLQADDMVIISTDSETEIAKVEKINVKGQNH